MNTKLSVYLNPAVIVAAISLISAGCGQNDHVTGGAKFPVGGGDNLGAHAQKVQDTKGKGGVGDQSDADKDGQGKKSNQNGGGDQTDANKDGQGNGKALATGDDADKDAQGDKKKDLGKKGDGIQDDAGKDNQGGGKASTQTGDQDDAGKDDQGKKTLANNNTGDDANKDNQGQDKDKQDLKKGKKHGGQQADSSDADTDNQDPKGNKGNKKHPKKPSDTTAGKGDKGNKGDKGDKGDDSQGSIVTNKTINNFNVEVTPPTQQVPPPAPAPEPKVIRLTDGCDKKIKSIKTGEGVTVRALDLPKLQQMKKNNVDTLPYLFHNKNYTATLDFKTIGGTNKHAVGGRPYLQDAMVGLDIELDLPPKNSIKVDADGLETFKATLYLNVDKYFVEQHHVDTEILCLLDQQICSGDMFHDSVFTGLINPKFGDGRPVINEYFSRQLKSVVEDDEAAQKAKGAKNIKEFHGTLTLELVDLLGRGGAPASKQDVIAMLYQGAKSDDQPFHTTLHLLVADDTAVFSQDTGMQIQWMTNNCAESNAVSPVPNEVPSSSPAVGE